MLDKKKQAELLKEYLPELMLSDEKLDIFGKLFEPDLCFFHGRDPGSNRAMVVLATYLR